MNLDRIQERLPDIDRMREITAENEENLRYRKGQSEQEAMPAVSSFRFRVFLALLLLAAFVWADTNQITVFHYSSREVEQAVSVNIALEDGYEKWYTKGVETLKDWTDKINTMIGGKKDE